MTANECLGPIFTRLYGSADTTYMMGIIIGLVLACTLFITFIKFIAINQRGVLKDE
jgi:hypothetical protein